MEQATSARSSQPRPSHTLLRSVLTLLALLVLLVCVVMWWWVSGSDAFDSVIGSTAQQMAIGGLLRNIA
ncbi:hypothetical protein [Dyella tabacisoli]|uniref:Uncharacterized protein n=1 Tax=Dyella tabacisoli TaxID=2282381 RepID=A0A369UIB9_9GAMM|nr:hypothetical protein [Dyella tabacisoli]RDD80296.1 hypothetical protein DVJ77_17750 [Dyella tabacisoli]